VAEGDSDQMRWLRKWLMETGHDIRGARNGRWALTMWKSFRPFDLIVSDFVFAEERLFIRRPENRKWVATRRRDQSRRAAPTVHIANERGKSDGAVRREAVEEALAFRRLAKLLEPSPQMTLPLGSED
jgi:CheY-like chemotaxis protein